MAEKKKDTRTRNWTVVVYPESAPNNWREIVEEWHIEWVESPLHDKDINANGEPKKPHWHLLLMFGSVKSLEQVTELVQPLNCPTPFGVHNSKALVRYMAHLDNPDKVQYSVNDIQCHGGIDLMDLLKPSSSERYTYIREMQQFCNANSITEFEDLFNYAAQERFDDWFPLLCDSCCYVMTQFLKSKRHNPNNYNNDISITDKQVVDMETGEILSDQNTQG